MAASLSIKGVRDGLLITVPEQEWAVAEPALLQAIDARGEFFQGARVAVQLGERELGAAELGRLREHLSERRVQLWAVLCESPVTRAAAANLGLALELSATRPGEAAAASEPGAEEAVLLQRTLRSGQRIRHPGHVVVFGDVNPGAEIIAGGHVIVWGRLRGVVHAGAAGDSAAVVCALDLAPTQLRIAGQIAVSPARRGRPQPETVRLEDGQLVAERWGEVARR